MFSSYHRHEQPGGYRPAPVDLSQVLLSSEHEEVVNLLAENEHNVWARERIAQGWTYGTQQVYVLPHIFTVIRVVLREKVLFISFLGISFTFFQIVF